MKQLAVIYDTFNDDFQILYDFEKNKNYFSSEEEAIKYLDKNHKDEATIYSMIPYPTTVQMKKLKGVK
jgi:hypothetical protein